MTIIFVKAWDGSVHELDADIGASLMEAAVQEGVPGIVGECGGAGACATCHIYVDSADFDRVGPPSDLEDDMLDFTMAERRQTSRLACQIELTRVLSGLKIEVPEVQQ